MARIVGVGHQAVVRQGVRDTLDALSGQPQGARDPSDGRRAVLDAREDLPASRRLPHRTRDGVTLRGQDPVEAEQSDDQPAEGIAGRAAARRTRRRFVDSMLSLWYS